MRGHALAAADVPVCASCEEPITHHPVIRGGEEFCCAGCGAGGPCICTGRVAPPDFDWQDEPPVSRRLAEQDAPPLYGERATFRPAQYDDLRALPLSGPAVLRVAGLRSQAELLDLANALEADPRIDALSLIRARLDDCWFSVTVPTVRELEEALLHLDRFEVRTRTHPAGIDVTVRAVDPAAAAAEAGTDVVARRPRLWQVPRSDELPTIEAAPTALAPEGSPADAPEYSAPEYSAPEYSAPEEYGTPEYSTPEDGTAEDGADERASEAPPVPPPSARSEPRGVLPPPLPVPGRRAESAPVSPAPPAPAPPITAREWDAEADRAPQAPAARTTPSAAPSPASSAAGAASEWDDAAVVPPAQPPAPAELAPAGPAQAVPPAATTSEPAASEHAVPEHAVPEHAVPERAVSEPTVVAYTAAEPAVAEPPAAAPATVAAGEGGIIAADARPGGAAPLREHLTLVAYPFNSFATLNEFQEAVRRLHGVTNVKVRRFYRGTLHLAVEYEDILPFAHRLRELDAFRWDMVAERDAEMEIMLVDDGAITVDSAASGRGPGDGASAHAPSGPATNRRDSGERVG